MSLKTDYFGIWPLTPPPLIFYHHHLLDISNEKIIELYRWKKDSN